jgi:hypothetical protein
VVPKLALNTWRFEGILVWQQLLPEQYLFSSPVVLELVKLLAPQVDVHPTISGSIRFNKARLLQPIAMKIFNEEKTKGLPVILKAKLAPLPEQPEEIIGLFTRTLLFPNEIFKTSMLILLKKALLGESAVVLLQSTENQSFMEQPVPIPNGKGMLMFPQVSAQLGFAIISADTVAISGTRNSRKKIRETLRGIMPSLLLQI